MIRVASVRKWISSRTHGVGGAAQPARGHQRQQPERGAQREREPREAAISTCPQGHHLQAALEALTPLADPPRHHQRLADPALQAQQRHAALGLRRRRPEVAGAAVGVEGLVELGAEFTEVPEVLPALRLEGVAVGWTLERHAQQLRGPPERQLRLGAGAGLERECPAEPRLARRRPVAQQRLHLPAVLSLEHVERVGMRAVELPAQPGIEALVHGLADPVVEDVDEPSPRLVGGRASRVHRLLGADTSQHPSPQQRVERAPVVVVVEAARHAQERLVEVAAGGRGDLEEPPRRRVEALDERLDHPAGALQRPQVGLARVRLEDRYMLDELEREQRVTLGPGRQLGEELGREAVAAGERDQGGPVGGAERPHLEHRRGAAVSRERTQPTRERIRG